MDEQHQCTVCIALCAITDFTGSQPILISDLLSSADSQSGSWIGEKIALGDASWAKQGSDIRSLWRHSRLTGLTTLPDRVDFPDFSPEPSFGMIIGGSDWPRQISDVAKTINQVECIQTESRKVLLPVLEEIAVAGTRKIKRIEAVGDILDTVRQPLVIIS